MTARLSEGPAHQTLRLPGETHIAWAEFDAGWYRATYPAVVAELGEAADDDAAVLEFYLEHGQRHGHSPNPWFDEAWHVQANLGAATAVREGHAKSGFDTYCHSGFSYRSPHWLFNEALYKLSYPDLRDDLLQANGSVNGYAHFLSHGSHEGRSGHWLFDPRVYRAQLDPAEGAEADAAGCYQHYLRHIGPARREIRTSNYFDPVWYLQRYKEVAEAIAAGQWLCALHHYLANDTPTAFDPLPEFSEQHYLGHYPDIAAEVAAGHLRNGYEHFLHNGAREHRSPCAALDLSYYAATHKSVAADLQAGRARDPFEHYLLIGRSAGLGAVAPVENHRTELQVGLLHWQRAENLLPVAARVPLDFSCTGTPALSVVMVVHDRFPLTLMTLASLRANFAGDIELVVIDGGSTDETRRLGRFVRGARLLRFDVELDLLRAANAALNCVTADLVLLLDNAVELAPGAIPSALRRIRSDPHIAAVGGKIVCADGRLESAGGILWRDGLAQDYLRDASPISGEPNFVRDVDYCSSACLLLRADVARELNGFDEALGHGVYADADLCLRVVAAGSRVVYDPGLMATRLAAAVAPAVAADAQQALLRKHANQLRFRYVASPQMEAFARATDRMRRVLFIDDTVPLRALGSGFVRSNDLIQLMALLGYRVTIYPINAALDGLATIYADLPDTTEVMHDRTIETLAVFLAARHGYYDTVWIARTHNLDRIKPILESGTTGVGRPPRIVLDTEAIAALRDARRAEIDHAPAVDVDAAIIREFAHAHFCQSLIAVNPAEAQKLRDLGFSDVAVIGHWRDVQPTPRPFAERSGMLFLAAIHEQESPNRDALDWFVREVLPLVEQALGWETRLTVAGYLDPCVSLDAYRDHARITLRGPVDDIVPLYDAHRIVVAPTRFAAGVPYKVHEAASYGLPVVATELLCRQLNWEPEHDLIAVSPADPQEFARRIVQLYRDAALWQTLRDNALRRIASENNRSLYEAAVRRVLEA